MTGKAAQSVTRMKKLTLSGRSSKGEGQLTAGNLSRSSSTSLPGKESPPRNPNALSFSGGNVATLDSTFPSRKSPLARHVQYEGGSEDKRLEGRARLASNETRKQPSPSKDGKMPSKVAGKIKSRIRSTASRKEFNEEQPLEGGHEADSVPASKRGSRNMQKLTPPKLRVRQHLDSAAKPRRRSKSITCTSRLPTGNDTVPSLDLSPSDANRTFTSSSSQKLSRELVDTYAVAACEDSSTSHERLPESERSVRSNRILPRTATASDILHILHPRRKGASSNVNSVRGSPGSQGATSEELFESVIPVIDLAESDEVEVADEDVSSRWSIDGRGLTGLKRPKKNARRLADKLPSPSTTSSSAHQDVINMCHFCATEFTSVKSITSIGSDNGDNVNEQLLELQERLLECEMQLQTLVETSIRNEEQFQTDIARFKRILGTVDQAQEIRYRSLLEVFTDNFKTMGTVEARFEEMLGTRERQMQTSSRGRLQYCLWLIADFAVKTLFRVLKAVSESHKLLKARRKAMFAAAPLPSRSRVDDHNNITTTVA